MHDVERIFADDAVDLVEIAERPAHADHLRIGFDLREPFDLLELLGEELLDLGRLLLGGAVVGKQVGERDGAEGERLEMQDAPAVVVDDLGAAAADLEDDPLWDVHRVDDAAVDERRLLLFGEHVDADPAGRLDLVEEGALVFGAADRRRRNGDEALDARGVAQAFEHFECLDGFGDALRLQKAVPVHVLTEADALLELVLHHEVPVSEHPHDHKPRGVRPEVDDADFFHVFECPVLSQNCRIFICAGEIEHLPYFTLSAFYHSAEGLSIPF